MFLHLVILLDISTVLYGILHVHEKCTVTAGRIGYRHLSWGSKVLGKGSLWQPIVSDNQFRLHVINSPCSREINGEKDLKWPACVFQFQHHLVRLLKIPITRTGEPLNILLCVALWLNIVDGELRKLTENYRMQGNWDIITAAYSGTQV